MTANTAETAAKADNSQKPRRVTVELTTMASQELDRLQKATGANISDLLRNGVTLLRVYVDSKSQGKEFRIVNPGNPQDQVRLELPISCRSDVTS